MSALKEQLMSDEEYFKYMLNMIPASYCSQKCETDVSDTIASVTAGGEIKLGTDKCDNLRDSLHQKIEELKSKRVKKGAPLDSTEKKRLKRKLSKAKLRERRRAEKQKNKGDLHAGDAAVKTETVPSKTVFSKDGRLVFSKFDFAEKSKKRRTGTNAEVPTGKNYKQLLKQAKMKEEKISEVEIHDKQQAQEMSTKEKWKSALKKAEGVKLKDNPDMLQKALKRREQKKRSSQKKWDAREKTVAKHRKEKQDKRATNIAKKKEGRVNKRIQKAKKRGRVRVD